MKKKIPILIKYFQKSKEKEMLPNSFYETKIDLITRQDVDTRGKMYRPIFLMNILFNKHYQIKCNNMLERSYTMIKGCKECSTSTNQ